MAEPALRLCADAGLNFEATERALLVPCANAPVDLLLVRAHDVPEYVQDGVVDLGITGANLVVESGVDVVTLAELGFARCTLQAAVPEDAPQATLSDLHGLRVATVYPASTRARLAEIGVEAELVPVSGSVEAAPRLGLSDAIVDLVSTGSTASANGLRLLGSAARVAGGPDRERGRASTERRELVERVAADALGRRRGAPPALSDAERAARPRSTRSGRCCPGWARPPSSTSPSRARSRCTLRSTPTTSGTCCRRCKAAGASSILVLPVERLVA